MQQYAAGKVAVAKTYADKSQLVKEGCQVFSVSVCLAVQTSSAVQARTEYYVVCNDCLLQLGQ